MAKISIFNLSQRELERINEITGAVKRAILSFPQIGLNERDFSFSFPQIPLEERKVVSVIISEESFFQGGMNLEIRQNLRRRVRVALKLILGEDGRNILVEIRRPKY